MSDRSRPLKHFNPSGNSGQIVLEYVLLLMIGVSIAILITTTMVSRNPQSPGFLIKKWSDILNAIGEDTPDDVADQP